MPGRTQVQLIADPPTRVRRQFAAVVALGCLAAPALPPAAPAAAIFTAPASAAPAGTPPAAAAPGTPPAFAPTGPAPAGTRPASAARADAPPAVAVAMTTAGATAPVYRIRVHNVTNGTVRTTVRQELPAGVVPASISDGGQARIPSGQADRTEVSWTLRLPPATSTIVATRLAGRPGAPVTAPACAYAGTGSRPYDCASATWTATAGLRGSDGTTVAWWQRQVVLAGALAALLVSVALALVWRRSRRQRAAQRLLAAQAAAAEPGNDPRAGVGTVYQRAGGLDYPRPAQPPLVIPGRRRRPPVWLVVAIAIVLPATTAGLALWSGAGQVNAVGGRGVPTGGAWVGRTVAGPIGAPLREDAFEFTVYRLSCPQVRGAGRARCEAAVGLRNLSGEEKPWYGALQRAYTADGSWVGVDEGATRAVNVGRDPFATAVPPDRRLVVPLVFTMNGPQPPERVELRSAVFSAGVSVDVP